MLIMIILNIIENPAKCEVLLCCHLLIGFQPTPFTPLNGFDLVLAK